MSEYRRRRIEPDEPKGGGGLPIFPLIVLVIFAGLLLGGGLAKFLGRGGGPSVPTPVPTVTPLPTESATPSLAPTPSPTPHATHSPKPTAKPSPSATPAATATPSPTPSPAASPTVKPSPKPSTEPTELIITPAPKPTKKPVTHAQKPPPAPPTPAPTLAPTPSPTPALITGAPTADHAAAIVRSYLTALANGHSSFATGYLRSGLPSEDFMKGGRVTNVQATANGDGSFFVTAAMETPAGSFTENFRVENGPNGLQITQHSPSVTH